MTRGLGRWLWGQSLIALVVGLPALVAGASLLSPPAAGEWERLAAAVGGSGDRAYSQVADGFLRVFVAEVAVAPDAGSTAAHELLSRARLAQVLGVLATSMLTYLVVVLASGRARALLTVLWLAVLPPVAQVGAVLRPETAASVFGLAGVLLLQLLSINERPAALRRGYVSTALGLSAALLLALAVATSPSSGHMLLVPGGALVASAAQVGFRLWRVLRERHVAVWPARAAAGRMWPWATSAVATLVLSTLLMLDAVHRPEAIAPTRLEAGLLPSAPWLAWPLLVLAGLGALRLVLRTGQRYGRRGRLAADLVLFVHVVALLLWASTREDGLDALPAAASLALLLADGSVHAFLLLAARRGRALPPPVRS